MLTAELLYESKAVERLFDAVLREALIEDAIEDIAALIGELDAFAKAVSDVEITGGRIDTTAEARRVISGIPCRQRKIVAAAPADIFRRGIYNT